MECVSATINMFMYGQAMAIVVFNDIPTHTHSMPISTNAMFMFDLSAVRTQNESFRLHVIDIVSVRVRERFYSVASFIRSRHSIFTLQYCFSTCFTLDFAIFFFFTFFNHLPIVPLCLLFCWRKVNNIPCHLDDGRCSHERNKNNISFHI